MPPIFRCGGGIKTELTLSLKCSIKPWKAGRSDARTISAHDLSGNHRGAGFANGFSKATPPVNKNLHSWSSIFPLKQIYRIPYFLNLFQTRPGFYVSAVQVF